ncbi:chemotaxis response regulator protein-glutamate methylesterase [Ligilactobacillus agilis]|uniref:Protein-glutamate methylesterase/protein-glutamine glutaminase n=2 Tax=Ligilactobacillus agilis TaxID=1601 RepID=A0A9Q9MTT9_9LACO|nr:chemotaxis response regulator protein-glutamate methylesterase [Ligilactobacillus agilis]UXC64307.1 chemotaxis response regulator protein-glutamate methylesterase [Ligilactobacillus agilis]UXC66309.1 chemotaxis response regulator protein-glutamate methylesterase [Ligilactobacillus agilis]
MIRILVVDDSAFMRKVITDLIAKMPGTELAGVARNGKAAVDFVKADSELDLVLMDVEMPLLNGLEALKQIKQFSSVPVVMLSALTNQEVTIEALESGATDFVEKPTNIMAIKDDWIREFFAKIKAASRQQRRPLSRRREVAPTATTSGQVKSSLELRRNLKAVVIGSSTGGPRALLHLITALPARLAVPVIIVQHMPKGFTKTFAERMDAEAKPKVSEVSDGMLLKNEVYLAPGDYHMVIKDGRLHLNQEPKMHGTRPAVDPLFDSAAAYYGQNLVGIILTGMGKDGAEGMGTILAKGGYTIAQDKDSCVVFGMPRSAIEKGVVNEVLSLDQIRVKLEELVR